MIIHVVLFRWMVLNDRFCFVEEVIFNPAHFLPCRASIYRNEFVVCGLSKRYRDMIPTETYAKDYKKLIVGDLWVLQWEHSAACKLRFHIKKKGLT